MRSPSQRPYSPYDLMRLRPPEHLLYHGAIACARATRAWAYPQPMSGDIEHMGLVDKIYWLYKTRYPIELPPRGSGLAELFRRQPIGSDLLPNNFIPDTEVTIASVGDLIQHPFLAESVDTLYADPDIREAIFGADFSTANLECPIMDGAAPFRFNTRTAPTLFYSEREFECIRGPAGARFDFVSTACNHSLDFGETGVVSTIRCLEANAIRYHGTSLAGDDATAPALCAVNSVKIANLAWTFGLNGRTPPRDSPEIVNRADLNADPGDADLSRIEAALARCRQQGAEFVMLHLHWGMEHEFYPTQAQVAMAHHLAEFGADAIIGHHPHVVQPVEIYQTSGRSPRHVPIYYSLGNLVNFFTAPWLCTSRVARMTLTTGTEADGSRRVRLRSADYRDVIQTEECESATLRLVAV